MKPEDEWTIIKAKKKLFNFDLGELSNFKDLIILFVKRDFVSYFKQTILGPLWYLIQPLFYTIIFTVVFGRIAKIPTDGIPQPLFYLAGLTLWNYFSECLTKTSSIFLTNANIFGKVYFPRITVPLSIIISSFIRFLIQFLLFLVFYFYFIFSGSSIHPSFWILFIPLVLLQSAFLGLGCGILISSLTTKYRDLAFLVGFGVQLWMYATPIVYPMSQIPQKWKWVFVFNPISSSIEIFRYAFMGSGDVNIINWIIGAMITLIILFFGIILFGRVEKSFMDRI